MQISPGFFSRLQEALTERGRSVAWLATETGISQSTIYRWNEGSAPQDRTLRQIAKALCIRKEWLANGSGERDDSALREDPLPYRLTSEPSDSGTRFLETMSIRLLFQFARELLAGPLNLDRVEDLREVLGILERKISSTEPIKTP